MEYVKCIPSPLGILTLTACEEGLTGLYLRCPTENEQRLPCRDSLFLPAQQWLESYFQGENPDPNSLSLILRGSPFRKQVWELLRQIPYGHTKTYGDLAREAACLSGKVKMSAQAIGGAVGHNPISIIIPCHRVIAAGNRLGGFGWGSGAKMWLLRHENPGCRFQK